MRKTIGAIYITAAIGTAASAVLLEGYGYALAAGLLYAGLALTGIRRAPVAALFLAAGIYGWLMPDTAPFTTNFRYF